MGTAWPPPTHRALHRRCKAWPASAGRENPRRVHSGCAARADGRQRSLPPIAGHLKSDGETTARVLQTTSRLVLRLAEFRHRQERTDVALADLRREQAGGGWLSLAVLGALDEADADDVRFGIVVVPVRVEA